MIRRIVELVAFSLVIGSREVRADPQVSMGLTTAGGAANVRTSALGVFAMGLHGDVLFLRNRDRDMALGPYLDVLSVAFETFEIGGGVSWLIPVTEAVPVVVSFGVHGRGYADGWEPGLEAMIWMGTRSYNFGSLYGLAAGLFVEGRWGLGHGQQADVLGGAQIDLEVFALPFVLLYNALK